MAGSLREGKEFRVRRLRRDVWLRRIVRTGVLRSKIYLMENFELKIATWCESFCRIITEKLLYNRQLVIFDLSFMLSSG